MAADSDMHRLRSDVQRLLAAALQSGANHAIELGELRDSTELVSARHADEVAGLRRDSAAAGAAHASEVTELYRDAAIVRDEHASEMAKLLRTAGLAADDHAAALANMQAALQTRDVIGQAKGVIMASLGCSPDAAFALLVEQSQAENRKLHDIAQELAARAQRGHSMPTAKESKVITRLGVDGSPATDHTG